MKRSETFAVPSVRHEELVSVLAEKNLVWDKVAHVTATTSLADAIRATDAMAVRILALIELVVMDGLGPNLGHSISSYPNFTQFQEDEDVYKAQEVKWWSHVAGRRAWQSIAHDDALRKFLRAGKYTQEEKNVLIESRREFKSSIQQLASAGVNPRFLNPKDQISKVATEAWIHLEEEYPLLPAIREDLWLDEQEFIDNKTTKAVNLRQRILATLNQLFGKCDGERTIVYHGFYFYTPPQWALFQLLSHMPEVKQIFVVHDDDKSDVFEIWREFFSEKVGMPTPEYFSGGNSVTLQAATIRNALSGIRIDENILNKSLEVLSCKSPTHFVRHWIEEISKATGEGKEPPRTYAPSADELDRYVSRFGSGTVEKRVDLTHLPIGIFLLRVHECISLDTDNNPKFSITPEALIDIVASGFLESESHNILGFQNVDVLERALPYFRGCKSAIEWQSRASTLRRLVVAEVSPRGGRRPADSDVERIEVAAGNILRLAPWADLSHDEAEAIENSINSLVSLLGAIAQSESAELKGHLAFLRKNLISGMSNLPHEVQDEILEKIEGMNVGEEITLSVDGLIDVVQILLSRKAEFDLTGGDPIVESNVNDMRGLDALGFKRRDHGIHIANLADGVFPSRISAVAWPYNLDNLSDPAARVPQVTRDLLEMRSRLSSLSDLYLLWLALDGVEPGEKITLSYIAEVGSDLRNPSSLLALLTKPTRSTPALDAKVGGLEYQSIKSGGDTGKHWDAMVPQVVSITKKVKENTVNKIDLRARASSVLCARRFALQWLLGPTTAFQSEHHHSILFGNVQGALVRHDGERRHLAERVTNDLWQHFTVGERGSSSKKARIGFNGPPAKRNWLFTLSGSQRDSITLDSQSYQTALGILPEPDVDVVVPKDSLFLPPRNPEAEQFDVCKVCPVKVRCAASATPDED